MNKEEELWPKELIEELEDLLFYKKKVKNHLDSLEFELQCMVVAAEFEAKK